MKPDIKDLQKKYDLKIRGVIHIGAHHGQEHSCYNSMGIDKQMFFEPLPKCFKVLKENVRGVLVNKALGNYNGKGEMYVSNKDGISSSLLQPYLHMRQYPHITFKEIMEVDVVRLDDFLKDEDYNFITIDVQGYELEVFKGAVETLKGIDYIYTEVNRCELYKGCVLIGELDKFLERYNFVNSVTVWEGRTWGNAFYIKT